ncbi:indolepyruvate oxidoreductase subunit beta [Methanolacinia paynteri]|uniref:indolepyruvate oxidoreductase subunit beta n=1 Tax=Methanolacinia paynteri TaxID=230356 RepID=UPI00064E6EE5|nr:indolepyruvate oxidoreductase subunit beta [Methanolacinia paynteri]
MTGSYDLLIVGVGGQGTILASNIIGEACLSEGRTVRSAETHGMSQRGGSVETHIRIDGKYGPLISPGTADLIISFDLLEAVRYSHFLKKGGVIVSGKDIVVPTSTFQQGLEVPSRESLEEMLSGTECYIIDAVSAALEAGNMLSQNIVMLGAASHPLPVKPGSLLEVVKKLVPPKTVEINSKAFEIGVREGKKQP